MRRIALLIGLVLPLSAAGAVQEAQPAPKPVPTLQSAVAATTRTAANVARDKYRNPEATLAFFGVKPSDTVVEIWPGGGWYTEVLAPYLAAGFGKLYAASPDWGRSGIDKLKNGNATLYGNVQVVDFPVFDGKAAEVPAGTADAVLTFRNVHNWRMGYRREGNPDYSADAFKQMYAMLKPGGVLGVEDHRLPESADAERERSSGYIKVSTVRRLAEEAGFRFVGASEVNANPRDTADWPNGVWTLPPALRHGDVERYRAIGESDRMTLKFVRPR